MTACVVRGPWVSHWLCHRCELTPYEDGVDCRWSWREVSYRAAARYLCARNFADMWPANYRAPYRPGCYGELTNAATCRSKGNP